MEAQFCECGHLIQFHNKKTQQGYQTNDTRACDRCKCEQFEEEQKLVITHY